MASFVLNFSVQPSGSCSNFNFFDITGNGITGYGTGGNPSLAQVTAATVSILPYGSTNAPFVVNVLNTTIPFPNINNVPFNIAGTVMGYSAGQSIPSQIVSMTYSVTANGITYTATQWIYLSCVHTCCADSIWAAWAAMPPCTCDAEQNQVNALEALAFRVSGNIIAIGKALNPDCNKITQAQNMVVWLNGACAQYPCGCS